MTQSAKKSFFNVQHMIGQNRVDKIANANCFSFVYYCSKIKRLSVYEII